MGNSQGKEGSSRPPWNDLDAQQRQAAPDGNVYSSRNARSSQNNLSSIFSNSNHREREREGPQDEAALAARRETKAEREARRIEKEKLARQRERDRSMREESVDGGFLVTQGVYTGPEDYNKSIVRSLMIDRRLAPFWPGLNDHSDSWAEHQLVAAVHRRPIPGADEPPAQTPHWPPADGPQYIDAGVGSSTSQNNTSSPPPAQTLSSSPPLASGSLLKGRAKGLASLTVPRGASSTDLTQRETTIPAEPTINGQRLEAYLYKDASECPICFLSYPPYLNRTRCCDQPICSECFVQIKRPEPHPPEHHDDPNNPTAQAQMTQEREQDLGEITLVSEPAQCPYCAQPEFGITFEPPPIRRGLVYGSQSSSNPSPLPSPVSSVPPGGRRRAASLPATAPSVITTDRIRPEWSSRLATARAHAARRSAAATALHTAAYMMGNNRERRLPLFGRRAASSRNLVNDEAGEGSSAGNENAGNARAGEPLDIVALMQAAARGPPGQRGNTRRPRAEEIEELMMVEAIRLSLAAEEERRKREEKERAKEEKKKAKEDKKAQKEAQKAARKASGSSSNLYGLMAGSRSNLTVNSAQPSMVSQDSATATPAGKGKGLARERSESNPYAGQSPAGSSQDAGAQAHLERSRANLQPPADPLAGSGRPSHLRNLSNASSTSSLGDTSPNVSGINIPRAGGSTENLDSLSATPPSGGAGLEPMVNFRSLMAMIEDEEREKADRKGDQAAVPQQSQNESEKHSDSATGIDGRPSSSPNGGPKHHVQVISGPMGNEQVG